MSGYTNFPKICAILKLLGVIMVTIRDFHAWAPQTLGATVESLVSRATWSLGFVHSCLLISFTTSVFAWICLAYWRGSASEEQI
jgi:hypothetical protein